MSDKIVKLGLGEAVKRLLNLELARMNGIHALPQQAAAERDLLFDALNEIKIDLGFDCNNDGVPDTIEIFEKSAETSCCRLIPEDMPAKPKRKRTSRRKAQK
jgi:hypothetical protein